ncbi:uncharacterized protein LOC126649160 [Myiozetetes cayanensis]|uniref:uncharacterized protein LOC126649160 n=1 Tax=Myiozetetes cayanensis TaxID=478635 RepID=UPI00215E49EF|nr:uncharacterized protein LOC126649160 [Myiozetetes cayanensis]
MNMESPASVMCQQRFCVGRTHFADLSVSNNPTSRSPLAQGRGDSTKVLHRATAHIKETTIVLLAIPVPPAKASSCSCCEDDRLQPGTNPWEQRFGGHRARAFTLEEQHLLERVRGFYLGSGPQASFRVFLSHGNWCQVKIAGSGWRVSPGEGHKGLAAADRGGTRKRKENRTKVIPIGWVSISITLCKQGAAPRYESLPSLGTSLEVFSSQETPVEELEGP